VWNQPDYTGSALSHNTTQVPLLILEVASLFLCSFRNTEAQNDSVTRLQVVDCVKVKGQIRLLN